MAYVDIQNGDDSDGILVKLNTGLALADKSVITVDTVQDLRDLPMIGGSYPKQVNTLGALSAGDGGEGSWRQLPAATAGTYVDNLGTVAVPTGGDGSRAWGRVFNGKVFDVAWFGAILDDSTDSTDAWLAAISASDVDGGGSVFVPGHIVVMEASDLSARVNDLTIFSAGMNVGQVRMSADGVTTLKAISPANEFNLHLHDITFRGNHANNSINSINGRIVNVQDIGDLRVERVRFTETQHNCINGRAYSFHCTNSEFIKSASGGIGVMQVIRDANVSNNLFMHTCDDSIGIHAYTSSVVSPEYKHARSNIVVTGNRIIDAFGINILGSKNTTIANNVGHRVKTRWIKFGFESTFDIGRTSQSGVTVTGNVLRDLYNANLASPGSTIRQALDISAPPTTDTANGVKPGAALAGGGVEELLPYMQNIGTTGPIAPSVGIVITGNVFGRTQGGVDETYESVHGIQQWDFDGFHNPTISNTDVIGYVEIEGSVSGLVIANNFFNYCYFALKAIDDTGLLQASVSDNIFTRTSVNVNGNNYLCDIRLINNRIDLDPYFEYSDHNNDGTWSALAGNYAVTLTNAGNGVLIDGNHFFNCSRPIYSNAGTAPSLGKNYQYGQFLQDTNNALNKGIRHPGLTAQGWVSIDYDADTGSATFRQILTPNNGGASAMPSSGYWLEGQFVRNTNVPAADGNDNILAGWVRKTSGNAHVLNTDWFEVYWKTVS